MDSSNNLNLQGQGQGTTGDALEWYKKQWQPNSVPYTPPSYVPPSHPCPSCGHCPTCGRGGYHQHPWYQPYEYPQTTWITCELRG